MAGKDKGVTLKDRKISEDNRRELEIDSIGEKLREIRLRLYGL